MGFVIFLLCDDGGGLRFNVFYFKLNVILNELKRKKKKIFFIIIVVF
jgi:hypothetical protein